jgi:hypothetical protein
VANEFKLVHLVTGPDWENSSTFVGPDMYVQWQYDSSFEGKKPFDQAQIRKALQASRLFSLVKKKGPRFHEYLIINLYAKKLF